MPIDYTTPDSPAAKAKGTVNPSDIPMTMSQIFSDEVKCVSTCGVCGIPSPRGRPPPRARRPDRGVRVAIDCLASRFSSRARSVPRARRRPADADGDNEPRNRQGSDHEPERIELGPAHTQLRGPRAHQPARITFGSGRLQRTIAATRRFGTRRHLSLLRAQEARIDRRGSLPFWPHDTGRALLACLRAVRASRPTVRT